MNALPRFTAGALLLSAPILVPAGGSPGPVAQARVERLMTQSLEGSPEKEVQMMTVEYGPAGASLPHRHNAQVFVYVLEGSVRMQVQGAPPVTLSVGGTFYEGPGDIHTVSQNASASKPARILVVMIKNKAAPVSVPAGAADPGEMR